MQFLWLLFFILLVIFVAMVLTGKINLFGMTKLGSFHRMLDNAMGGEHCGKEMQGGYSDEMEEYITHGGEQSSHIGGEQSSHIGGEHVLGAADGMGIVFESGTKEEKKEIKELKAEGVAIAKNVIITGNVDVKGSLELRNSEVKGKMNVVGSLVSVGSDFGDLTLNGHGDVFRSKAGKINLCGKLKSKKSEIKQIDFSKSCKVGDMRAPFINLSETPVGKIVLPEGLKEEEIVKMK